MATKEQDALYYVVKKNILKKIHTNQYKIGDKIPTEMELCKEYNVSRTTVRIALQQLALEGRINKIQGKGSFVAKPKIQQSLSTSEKSFAHQLIEQGYKPRTEIIDLKVIPADSSLANHLMIEENDPIHQLARIRYADDEPLFYAISYIPWHMAPGLVNDEEGCKGSLYQLLREKYQVEIHKTIEEIEPALASKSVSEYLSIPEGTPVFSLETITYNKELVPIEYSESMFRGDRSKFTIERLYSV